MSATGSSDSACADMAIAPTAVLPGALAVVADQAEGGQMARRPGRLLALVLRAFGAAMLGLAALGVVLPGVPTTIFLLLAVWAFGRSNPELADRIERHPRFGPVLVNWRTRRAVPRRAKILAAGSMAASWLILWFTGAPDAMLVGVGAILIAVSAYLWTRPDA